MMPSGCRPLAARVAKASDIDKLPPAESPRYEDPAGLALAVRTVLDGPPIRSHHIIDRACNLVLGGETVFDREYGIPSGPGELASQRPIRWYVPRDELSAVHHDQPATRIRRRIESPFCRDTVSLGGHEPHAVGHSA